MDMYLVGRTRAVNPATPQAALEAAVETGQRASQIIGRPVYTWTTIFGPEPLSVMWSARVDHLAEIVAADDALAADDDFNGWVAQHDELFASPLVGVVSRVVYGAPAGDPKSFLAVTRAVAANGSLGAAMAVGVEVAEMASKLTGLDTMFLAPVTGHYGGAGWIVGAQDLDEVEASNEKLASSDEWLTLVDRAGQSFAPGTTTMMLRRLA